MAHSVKSMEHHALAKWKVGRRTLGTQLTGVILPVMSSDESPVAPTPDPIPSPTLDESMGEGGAGWEEDGGEEMKEEREEGQEGEEEEEEEEGEEEEEEGEEEEGEEEEEEEKEEESYVSSRGRVRIAKRKFRALGE
ncbi:hypothetical protein Esi_0172_0035 [Ectocarpus siliculosus]|uniref:Uncharacterized protein n=1 Tax=Ectocarpus siliculosus TaxID=2880 RepID=D7FMY8_ECTSI|nr:hypothetical protein Esi_0172_0035 [Ectocarpus siliculosus]|eukprot:CBJ30052.1 hypothetical protein Esi_0172_0035 [Ectocarpus siliculosus]